MRNLLKIHSLILFLVSCFLVIPAMAANEGIMSDPMTIGVGARPLGMGRAYVGVAEDGDAIFMNPAGIARITNPKVTSMYTSLLQDVNYMVVGGAYPISNKSAIGAGIISSSMTDITLTSTTGATTGTGKWSNSVMFLSYGTYLSSMPMFANLDRDILVGANLKYFSAGGDGTSSITNASSTGMSADLAMLYPATDYMNIGINYQNALGGTIGNDKIAPTLKVGTKLSLIGREGQSFNPHANRKLTANIDYDVNSNNRPNAAHLGVEFWPSSNLALRGGVDGSELTAGLGLRFSGVEFNYAYHPFDGIASNSTHFFSLGYLGEAQKRALRVQLDSPKDKSVIHEEFVKVSGKVIVEPGDEEQSPAGPVTIKVNGINIPVKDDLSFNAEIPISVVGKKMIVVEAGSKAGDIAVADLRVLRLIQFADVPEGYWAQQPIENTGTVGLVNGYPDGSFQPDRALTRAELATLLVRAKGLKVPERQARKIFKDVPPDFWASKYIEIAQNAGLVKGYPDKSFRPNNRITKAEGIAVLVRFDNIKLGMVEEKPYWDVKESHWAAKYIQAAKDAGMLKFVERNQLNPKSNLSRAESVEMFSKTNLAGNRINDLYTWERGFKREAIPIPGAIGSLPDGVLTANK